jgi:hypothetical protein
MMLESWCVGDTVTSGGERGIRTPEARFRRLHTFQACSFNRSDTSPEPRILATAGRGHKEIMLVR